MTRDQEYELISLLQNIKGAYDYSGDASFQVMIPLKDGRKLRVGITDEDVVLHTGLWFDLDYKFNLR